MRLFTLNQKDKSNSEIIRLMGGSKLFTLVPSGVHGEGGFIQGWKIFPYVLIRRASLSTDKTLNLNFQFNKT